jgi:fructosamine-3-kinase
VNVAGVAVSDVVTVGGGDMCRAVRGRVESGRSVFAKTRAAAPADFFAAEARGLDRLRVDGGPPLPQVIAVGADGLVLEWVEPGEPTGRAAETFGRSLARLHATGQPVFGATSPGYIGSLPLDNTPTESWPAFYVERRVAPYLSALAPEERQPVEAVIARIDTLAGPRESPALIHGDLWSGNVLWAADGRAWLVDAASAHAGHRETDLAMLTLFGAPHVERILAAYDETAPLADGWRARQPLHRLHPLLVHAQLFGGGYGSRAAAAARAVLAG